MQTFDWIDARSIEHAVQLLSSNTERNRVVAKAGGMDLIDLLKEGIVQPTRVVNLKSIPGLNGISFDRQAGLRLGALVTLADIADSAVIRENYVALSEAANHAATPQIRNAATIGGNLMQRPRCWYFRNAHFHSQATATNPALHGENQYHAIFDNSTTAMVHASTLATALIAYDASVHLVGPNGILRAVPLKEFLVPPDMRRDNDTVIKSGEVLSHVTVPANSTNTRAAYFKQTERDSYDWPLFDVAVVLQMKNDIVDKASIVIGWVAPTPRIATKCAELLRGKKITAELAREIARAAVNGATPLSSNAYKLPMLEAVIARTILNLL